MQASEIFSIILTGAASLLCLALIFYLNKITRSVTNIEKSISELSTQIEPILENITAMTEKVNDAADGLKQPMNEVIDIVDEIKERVDLIFQFEEKIRNSFSDNLIGFVNGIKTFWNSYKGNGIHNKSLVSNQRNKIY